jgi:hypothetical protein
MEDHIHNVEKKADLIFAILIAERNYFLLNENLKIEIIFKIKVMDKNQR